MTLIAFSLIVSMLLFPNIANAVVPVPNKTLKITIKKAEVSKPTVSDILIENIPPEDYRVALTVDYYRFKIVGDANTNLYTGWVVNRITIPPDPINPHNYTGGEAEVDYPLMTLNLPYFDEAKKFMMYDENDNLLLDIGLHLYGFPDSSVRYAECDSCGYCRYAKIPGDWEKCRACIYPDARKDPVTGDTLKIDSATGLQITSKKGHAYTKLGCIKSDGLDTESGRASTVNFILTVVSGLTGGLAMIFLSYGAFLILKSKGDVEQISRGKRIITRTIIGVILAVAAILIVNIIAGGVLRIPGFK